MTVVGLPPPAATAVFGDQLPLAERYATFLGDAGIVRGLLGPHEGERIWHRHLLNCAVITELLPDSCRVVDVGSGAGLPGLVIAIRRPDVHVDLVESLQRRVDFLAEAVEVLDLAKRVRVIHGRAEDSAVRHEVGLSEWVTARAVAPLDRLAQWCLPLLATGGTLLAMKGAHAATELDTHQKALRHLGGANAKLIRCGETMAEPAVVIAIERAAVRPRRRR